MLMILIAAPAWSASQLRIAVAANFRHTLEQINRQYQRETGQVVVLSSAATGTLYNQVINGAPYDIFFAADRATPQRLAANHITNREDVICYARGRLVLIGSPAGLARLADPKLSVAIANPVTAPYGRAALRVLARPEFASGQGRKLVRGSNTVQAYQFWHSGGVDMALVPRALAPDATPVPAQWHDQK